MWPFVISSLAFGSFIFYFFPALLFQMPSFAVSSKVILPNLCRRFQCNHCSAFFLLLFPPYTPSVLLISIHSASFISLSHSLLQNGFFLVFHLFRNLKPSSSAGTIIEYFLSTRYRNTSQVLPLWVFFPQLY